MKNSRKILVILIVVLFVSAILGLFIYVNNKPQSGSVEDDVVISNVDNVVLRNLDINYPPTPKEVLKYYSEITMCFYEENLSEEDLVRLAQTARKLYDAELCADITEEEYLASLREDILEFNSLGIVVSGYTVSSSTDVEEFVVDGRECARLYATYRLRQGTEYIYSNEVFIMRKDENGHWKILGWELLEEEEVESLQETMGTSEEE
ncbi:MAG: hypothetical protein J6A80_06780 [Lachnospiraceae bacterium]|nr:hypothetical protein [Lachnospiraceae bacterium]